MENENGFVDFLRNNKWKIVFIILGLTVGILMITIGFFKTLLLCMIVGACYLFGSLLDKGGIVKVKEFFDALFKRK